MVHFVLPKCSVHIEWDMRRDWSLLILSHRRDDGCMCGLPLVWSFQGGEVRIDYLSMMVLAASAMHLVPIFPQHDMVSFFV